MSLYFKCHDNIDELRDSSKTIIVLLFSFFCIGYRATPSIEILLLGKKKKRSNNLFDEELSVAYVFAILFNNLVRFFNEPVWFGRRHKKKK